MQTRTQRFNAHIAELPLFSLPTALVSIGVSWVALMFYDVVLGDYEGSPYDFDLLRALIPILAFGPMFIRLLRPKDLTNDAEAYDTFVRLTIITLVMVVLTALLGILPYSYSASSVPDGFLSFIVGRAVSIVPLLALPVIFELIVRLIRYRSRRSVPRIAVITAYSFMVAMVLAQLFPVSVNPLLDSPTPAFVIAAFSGMLVLILAGGARWIVNLRKRQKFAVLGLSFLGICSASFILSLQGDSDVAHAMAATFPGLTAIGYVVGMVMFNMQLALFVHALIALPTAGVIDRRTTELSSLAIFSTLLTRTFDLTDLVETSIGVACSVTGSRAAWVELEIAGARDVLLGTSPRLTASDALRLMSANMSDGTTLAASVRSHRRVTVVDRTQPSLRPTAPEREDAVSTRTGKKGVDNKKRVDNKKSVDKRSDPRELCTVAAAPLIAGDTLLGTLYVAKERSQEFDRDDLAILKTIADQISMAMQHSKLIHSSIERERIEQEMMIARDLQQRLLPRSMPVSEWYDIHAESEPAHLVGGDYYDIVSFIDGTLGIVIADVSGKGPSAALYMGMIKGVIQALAGSTATPKDLLAKINIALHGQIDQRWFATMTCAQILEESRTLRIARAGHCPTLVVRDGIGAYHRSRGIGVAITRPLMFETNLELEDVHFSPDDYVVFLSDGLPEARSPEGEEFGYDRLLSVVTEAARQHPSPCELRDTIFNELSAFTRDEPPVDDSTIVLLRWKSNPASLL